MTTNTSISSTMPGGGVDERHGPVRNLGTFEGVHPIVVYSARMTGDRAEPPSRAEMADSSDYVIAQHD